MPVRCSERLIWFSKGWLVLVALVIFVCFTTLVLPGQAAGSGERTGGARQPDTSLFYTPAELHGMAEALGPDGRQAYIQARFTFDVVWPLVYGFFLVTAISWLAGKAFQPGSPWRLLNLAPVLGVMFDYLEKGGVPEDPYLEHLATSLVMARYPAQTPVVDLLAGPLTLVKWLFVGGSFMVLVAVAIAAVARRARPR